MGAGIYQVCRINLGMRGKSAGVSGITPTYRATTIPVYLQKYKNIGVFSWYDFFTKILYFEIQKSSLLSPVIINQRPHVFCYKETILNLQFGT